MLDDEVGIEVDRLQAGKQRVIAVEISPTGLDHADSLVAEIRQHATQELRFGNEICVEDRDEFTGGKIETVLQGASLVAFA